jgi:hypothetical protein
MPYIGAASRPSGASVVSIGSTCARLSAMQTLPAQWCRDVDWGTAPQWGTIVVAAIVGAFSIWGIVTARDSYKRSVKDTHEAQARLVYAELLNVRFIPKGTSIAELPGGTLVGDGMRVLDDKLQPIMFSEQDRAYFTLGVVNKSKELIGEVEIGVVDGVTKERHRWVRTFFTVVNPEDDDAYTVGAPDEWHGTYSLSPWVKFRDSGGATWTRVGSEPVKEVIDAKGLHGWQRIKKGKVESSD